MMQKSGRESEPILGYALQTLLSKQASDHLAALEYWTTRIAYHI